MMPKLDQNNPSSKWLSPLQKMGEHELLTTWRWYYHRTQSPVFIGTPHCTESLPSKGNAHDSQPPWPYKMLCNFKNATSSGIIRVRNTWYCLPLFKFIIDGKFSFAGRQYLWPIFTVKDLNRSFAPCSRTLPHSLPRYSDDLFPITRWSVFTTSYNRQTHHDWKQNGGNCVCSALRCMNHLKIWCTKSPLKRFASDGQSLLAVYTIFTTDILKREGQGGRWKVQLSRNHTHICTFVISL